MWQGNISAQTWLLATCNLCNGSQCPPPFRRSEELMRLISLKSIISAVQAWLWGLKLVTSALCWATLIFFIRPGCFWQTNTGRMTMYLFIYFHITAGATWWTLYEVCDHIIQVKIHGLQSNEIKTKNLSGVLPSVWGLYFHHQHRLWAVHSVTLYRGDFNPILLISWRRASRADLQVGGMHRCGSGHSRVRS